MSNRDQEQLREALFELNRSREREAMLLKENAAILDAISSITGSANKEQIFQELRKVLSLYIDFDEFLVLSKTKTQNSYTCLLTTNPKLSAIQWYDGPKFSRVLDGETIVLFDATRIGEIKTLNLCVEPKIRSALLVGVCSELSDAVILLLGNKVGQFSLNTKETLTRFRPLLERAVFDIEHKEQLTRLVQQRTIELELAKKKAIEANEAKSKFLAMMSHEFRTPLNSVLGYIDVLSNQLNCAESQQILSQMTTSAEMLLALIGDILEVTQIERGKFPLNRRWINLEKAINNSLAYHQSLAENKGLDFSAHVDTDNSHDVFMDSSRLSQIIFNIVGNAVKFTDSGKIDMRSWLERDVMVINVRDTGIGIAQCNIEKLFMPFVQADSSITRKFGGSGLGLSITKHIVEQMGGEIELSSKVNEGTSVTVRIPLQTRRADNLFTTNPHKHVIANGKHVLVVEDTKTNQVVAKLILENNGFKVSTLDNGALAVDYMQKTAEKVDVVLMDLSMPVMDGITATKKIREFNQHTPIVALTAHAASTDRNQCLTCGMDEFVCKPIRQKEILSVIDNILDENKSSQECLEH
ncbi:response regulator [Vibrio astriarenae]